MIANFVRSKGQKAIILLDAFFESGDAFNTAEEEADNVTLIMRAKGNTVAFELPEQPKNEAWQTKKVR